jgi:UDP-glucuronate 4-epimerase
MKILVTGVAGFIGSNLLPMLLNNNHQVVGIDNLNDYYPPEIKKNNINKYLSHPKFTFIINDIENRTILNDIFNTYNFDTIIHLAARAGVRASLEDPFIYNDTNIIGTTNLLEFSRQHSVKQFIFASSSSVYGERDSVPFKESDACGHPISPYAASKRSCELFCYTYSELFKINMTIIRFFNVYGPNNRPRHGSPSFC